MKAQLNENFGPFDLTLTFESQEEVDRFYELFNYNPVTSFLPFDTKEIRHELRGKINAKICINVNNIYQHLRNHI